MAEPWTTLEWELIYSGLTRTTSAAHIDLGQRGVDGGVAALLCGGGEEPACPATGGTLARVMDQEDGRRARP